MHAPRRRIDVHSRRPGLSPYAGRKYPTRPLFGDTHCIRRTRADAFTAGARLTARGRLPLCARRRKSCRRPGVPAKLSRPLDFSSWADHAEGLGLMQEVYRAIRRSSLTRRLAGWSKAIAGRRCKLLRGQNEVSKARRWDAARPIKDPKDRGPGDESRLAAVHTGHRREVQRAGSFTAMIGYEWTSGARRHNLHRNTWFPRRQARPDQVFRLVWKSRIRRSSGSGCAVRAKDRAGKMLAIAHTANLSNGRMFELTDFAGRALHA